MNLRGTQPAEASEIRQLTIVFCDLVDSTGISQRLGLEDYRALLDSFHAHCASIVQHYDGHIAESEGDGAVYYFGWPTAHDDDPRRAVQAALDVLGRLGEVSKRYEERYGEQVLARIGVDTGRVLVGDMGAGGRRERRAVGPTTNKASRLQGLAPPGRSCISGETHSLVEGYFSVEPFGRHELKGFEGQSIQVYLVHSATGAETRLEVALRKGLTPFVGREDSLTLLRRAWQDVETGLGRVVLVSGEAGVGKSRCVHEFQLLLRGHATAFSCFCSPYQQNTELHPLKDLIARRLGFEQAMSSEERVRRLRDRLDRLPNMPKDALPLLSILLSIPATGGVDFPEMSPQRRLQRTLEVVVAWLMGIATRQPTLLVLEDVHWADPATIEFLDMVVDLIKEKQNTDKDGAESLPLCLVLTLRPQQFAHPWSSNAEGPVRSVELGTLGQDAASELIKYAAGNKSLPEVVSQRIIERTAGLPLFVEEVTRAVVASGILEERDDYYVLARPLPDDLIPDTVEGTLQARLDNLGPIKQVAQFASVLGREFRYDVARAAAPAFEGTEIDSALKELVRERLLLCEGAPPAAFYVFRHELIRDVAYNSLLPSVRAAHHGRIADLILERFPDVAGEQPQVLAHHLESAGERDRAFGYWCKAGSKALHAADQFAHYSRALSTLPSQIEAQTELGLQKAAMFALMTWKGWAAPEVEQACQQAMEMLSLREKEIPVDRPDLHLLIGMSRFGTVWGLWTVHFLRSDLYKADALAKGVMSAATQSGEALALELAHHAMAYTNYFQGNLTDAAEHARQGLALYSDELEQSAIANFQFASANALRIVQVGALWQTGMVDQASAQHQEGDRIARGLGHLPSLAFWLTVSASYLCCRQDYEAVISVTDELIPLARAERLELWGGPAMIYRGWARAHLGAHEEGLADVERGVVKVLATGSQLMMVQAYGLLAQVELLVDRPQVALETCDRAILLSEKGGEKHMLSEVYRQRAQARHHLGDSDAVQDLYTALDVSRRQGARSLELRAALDLRALPTNEGKPEVTALIEDIARRFPKGVSMPELLRANGNDMLGSQR